MGRTPGSVPAPGAAQGTVLAGGAGPQGEPPVVCVRRVDWTHGLLTLLREEREQQLRRLAGGPAPPPPTRSPTAEVFRTPRGLCGHFLLSHCVRRRVPPQLPPSPAAVPRAPTSPIAEAVPHGHSLRTPIAIAPARAKTRQSPSMGTSGRPDKDPRSQRSRGTLQAQAVTHPRSPSSVLWISFRTPAGPGKRRAETSRGWAQHTRFSPFSWWGVRRICPPQGNGPQFYSGLPSLPRTSLMPAHQLLPQLTLVIEQSVLHHWDGPSL